MSRQTHRNSTKKEKCSSENNSLNNCSFQLIQTSLYNYLFSDTMVLVEVSLLDYFKKKLKFLDMSTQKFVGIVI